MVSLKIIDTLHQICLQAHVGVSGVVRDDHGTLLSDVTISVDGIQHNVTSSQYGDYWRLLTSGEYRITASKAG